MCFKTPNDILPKTSKELGGYISCRLKIAYFIPMPKVWFLQARDCVSGPHVV